MRGQIDYDRLPGALRGLPGRFGAGHDSLAGRALAGAISGGGGSATSIGAPLVVLYLLGREPDIQRFRATLLAFFLSASVVTLALFIFIGRVDSDVLTVGAAGVPAIVAGVITGGWPRGHVEAEFFRCLVVGLLVCVSVLVIAFTALGLG